MNSKFVNNDLGGTLFSKNMRLVELININYNLIGTLHRMELSLDYCEKTVKEACEIHNVDPTTFILMCNVYSYSHYKPTLSTIKRVKARDIVKYLHNSHSYYMQAIDDLGEKIKKLLEKCNEKKQKVLWKFFADYRAELFLHFSYEEEVVFPYIDKVLSNQSTDTNYSMSKYQENHSNIDEKLSDLKNLIMRYLPSECDEQTRKEVLFQIYYLEEDLERHTSIEDDILVPLVNLIENNV